MEAKDFELPIEGSLSKLALLHIQHEELSKQIDVTAKKTKFPLKSDMKKKSTRTTNKK